MQYQTRHSSPFIPRDSAPRLWGRGPSPTFPTLPGWQPAPSFPTCFLPPVPVFCEAAVPPISLLGRTSLGSAFSQTLLLPNGRAPAGGGRVLGDPPSFPHVCPCGVPSDPLWNIFLPVPSLRFHLTIPSAHPTLFTPGPALPGPPSAAPRNLSFPRSFPFSFISVPSPITLS